MKLQSTDEYIVRVENGKYTFGLRNGIVTCLRYGEEWPGGATYEHSSSVAALIRELHTARNAK